jgi:Na+/H+ antiporter NhaD/arsenite permease-like protein
MVVAGQVTPTEAYFQAIDYRTIGLLLGMMVITAYLEEAGFFRWASLLTVQKAKTPRRLLVGTVAVCALLSAFLVNDTVCLLVTPLVVRVVDEAELPPLPFLLAVAFGSNAGSAGTPTGNPQNVIVANLSGLSYADFVSSLGPSAVAATAIVILFLLILFGRELGPRPLTSRSLGTPELDRPMLVATLTVLAGVIAAFVAGFDMSFSALAGASALLLLGRRPQAPLLARVNWSLLLFFASLFVVVYGLGKSGAGASLFASASKLGGPASEPWALGGVSILGSNLLSNVPFVLLASSWIPSLADPATGWKVLALTSTLAGNLTIVGSVANLIVLELAGARGRVSFWRFLAYGLPITLATSAAGVGLLLGLRGS